MINNLLLFNHKNLRISTFLRKIKKTYSYTRKPQKFKTLLAEKKLKLKRKKQKEKLNTHTLVRLKNKTIVGSLKNYSHLFFILVIYKLKAKN